MSVDVAAAHRFVHTHGRLLDRLRALRLQGQASTGDVVRALLAHQNDDGGFGHALEPDVRTPHSETVPTLSGLEQLDALGRLRSPEARAALEWVGSVVTPDGGVPFLLARSAGWPVAPWMSADGRGCHLTFGFVALAERAGVRPAWYDAARRWCERRLGADDLSAYTVKFALALVDARPPGTSEAVLDRLRAALDGDGCLPVAGGNEGERLTPLYLSPHPGSPSRAVFTADEVERDLDRLASGQQEDGGWRFDWDAWCPAQELEWRGALTVDALETLAAHGR